MPLRYFGNLPLGRCVLWCYLVWYIVMVALYFDPSPSIWVSALGVSALIGVAFLLGAEPSPARWHGLDGWMVMRFFLIPFGVSSFAALVKGRGFLVVFSPVPYENAAALGACGLFLGFCWLSRRFALRDAVAAPATARHPEMTDANP